ncbi:unnamed protein product [Knipowitschia caucasica]
MEREIEELERAVLENCRLLEEVEGAKPKRFQERHAADGYSTARPQRPLEAGWTPPHSASENQSTERPQRPLEAGRTSPHHTSSKQTILRPRRPLEAVRKDISSQTGNIEQNVQVNDLLGGGSAHTQRQTVITHAPRQMITPKTPAKLPKYSGTTPVEPFLAQVRLASWHSGWSDDETATHLALALEGVALQILLDLSLEDQQDLQALMIGLERRFGKRLHAEESREQLSGLYRKEGENLGTFAANIQFHTQRGYPQFPVAARDELALHAFLQGLTPERLRQYVRLARPRCLNEALQEAERAEIVLSTRPNLGRATNMLQRVRHVDYEEVGVEEVYQLRTPAPRGRRRTATDRCFRCDEPGHLARNCPAPSPKAREPQPTGNDRGVE